MKGPIIGIVIVLALLATGAIFLAGSAFQEEQQVPLVQTYANDLFGISFTYPAGYVLAEAEVGTVERPHYVITIIQEEDAVPRVNSEGPTAIRLNFYQNTTRPLTIPEWLATDESNFNLGNGMTASTSLDGTDAVSYQWSGLYQGETMAFLHNGWIVAASVTYTSPADQIYTDYQMLLSSLVLR
jgi:hypothetical protein